MQSIVFTLSGERMYRDLFWLLAEVAPMLLAVLVVLAIVPRWRQIAATGMLASAVGAVLVAVVFHHTCALGIWAGHDSAIRSLDQAALRAGFAASALLCGIGLGLYRGACRTLR